MREIIFPMIKTNLATADDETSTLGLLRSMSVIRMDPLIPVDESQVAAVATLKDAQGRSISKYIAQADNTLAISMIENRNTREKLAKFPRAKLIEIYNLRVDEKLPEVIPEDEKTVYSTDMTKLRAFLLGQMPSDTTVNKILNIMSL
jgi:hypothetical protein